MSGFPDLRRIAARVLGAARPELAFAARAWLVAPLVEGALGGLGVRRTLALVARVPRRRRRAPTAVGVEDGAAWVHRAYAVHALRGRCLPRAVIQHLLHRLDGTPSQLVIGVRGDSAAAGPVASLDAHAWVADPNAPIDGDHAAILVVDDEGVRPAAR